MAKIIGILFEEDDPKGGCAPLIIVIIVVALGWWGTVTVRNWIIGPEAVKKEQLEQRIESLSTKKEDITRQALDSHDPFATNSAKPMKPKELIEVEKELASLKSELTASEISKKESEKPQAPIPREPDLIQTFESVRLPFTVVTVESVHLLDQTGQEQEIPQRTRLRIVGRKPSGTLTVEANGNIFIGNETRLAGKVRPR